MKRSYRTVATLLLMLLLLMQVGNAAAWFVAEAVMPRYASAADAQRSMVVQKDAAMPEHRAQAGMHTQHQGNSGGSADGGCAGHCIATGLTTTQLAAHVEPAPYLAVPFLALHLRSPGPARLERPPNLLS